MHVTESRTIASRCPKLRTSKGHLVYKRPPARSQLRSRKPILRHACYNHTRSTHALYEQQVSLQFSTKYTTLLITLTECTQRSQACDPTLHQTSTEANYVLVKTSLTNGLRSMKENTTTLQRAQAAVWDYTTWSTSSSRGRPPSGSVVSSLKHKLSKHEYKDVLSKTYKELYYLCTCIKVKGVVVQLAEVPALTWLVLIYEYQREVRTYTSPSKNLQSILHYGAPLDFPTIRHVIALTLILASFISNRSSCL